MLTPLMRSWHFMLAPTRAAPTQELMDVYLRRYRSLLDEDLANVAAGYYPRDLLFDFPLGRYAKLLPRGVFELPSIYWRRARKRHEDLPRIENREFYPDYYLRTFHWQSDGWLSDHSAKYYDVSVEVLFVGTAGIMRRMTIPALVASLEGRAQPSILDVACGTGSFLRQLHGTFPKARLSGIDLSPYYLRRAHDTLNGIPGVTLVADNAEAMPFAGESFDAVSSIFLFHELPRSARMNVLQEMYRVLRPGGCAVICDSAQRVESAELEYFFDLFPALYHEPYFKTYVSDPLEATLEACGFQVSSSRPHFLSKVVVATKH